MSTQAKDAEKLNRSTENAARKILEFITGPSTRTIFLAILFALVLSAFLVVIFDEQVRQASSYFFARPSDTLVAAWASFSSFFTSMFRGCIYNYTAPTVLSGFIPLTETLTRSVPLIIAGLAFTTAFRSGLFNIGVQGQLIIGAVICGYLGFHFHLPMYLHLPLCILGGVAGGMLYGFIPGILRAKLKANEVIVTIMLNSVAMFLLAYLLQLVAFKGEGNSGKSMTIAASSQYPLILGSSSRLHLGFIIALLATFFVWWLLERSTFGFQLRAAGSNPLAAETAGINVNRILLWTLVISGGLSGLAATAPVMGTEHFLTNGVASSYGFDAITVSLLGKANPLGTLAAGILFGALNSGSSVMQASANIPVDIVQITQAVIVLVIAAADARHYYQKKGKRLFGSKTKRAKSVKAA